MKLRDAFSALLDGWRGDVDPRWLPVLANVEPDVAAIDASLSLDANEVIFPARKGHPPAGARPDSHIFRALDGVAPDAVSVVVMGQDPYQNVGQATGRSFEQGDLRDWLGNPRVSPSLQRIIQALATARTGDERYVHGAGCWNRLVTDVREGRTAIAAPRELWDGWQSRGVLFVNAILTFTRAEPAYQFDGHGRLWAPIVRTLLGHVARRQGKPVVFVAWGDKANDAFEASGAKQAAQQAGTWEKTVRLVRRPHPNARANGGAGDAPFLRGANPFTQINEAVEQCGGRKIDW